MLPVVALLTRRGKWIDSEEARRWKFVLIVFGIWALGPFLTVAGLDTGLPLPQALARFVPLVENARMPGRAMVCVYLALGVLMALRMGSQVSVGRGFSRATIAVMLAFAFLDYLHSPIPLTPLDRASDL